MYQNNCLHCTFCNVCCCSLMNMKTHIHGAVTFLSIGHIFFFNVKAVGHVNFFHEYFVLYRSHHSYKFCLVPYTFFSIASKIRPEDVFLKNLRYQVFDFWVSNVVLWFFKIPIPKTNQFEKEKHTLKPLVQLKIWYGNVKQEIFTGKDRQFYFKYLKFHHALSVHFKYLKAMCLFCVLF